ncbi:MAG: glycosyltransferase [Chryseolinea sp.]
MADISIIVCCHNGASKLPATLTHLFSLRIPANTQCEIVLVDNASTDNTSLIAREYWGRSGNNTVDFRVVQEPNLGLTYARNAGIANSTGELIIFCDDDNHLQSNYVFEALKVIEADNKIAIVGGLALPQFSTVGRAWLVDFYRSMAIGPQGPHDGYVDWVYGAGMVIKRSVFLDIRQREIALSLTDRTGNDHTSGGDAEICELARFIGYQTYYCSSMTLIHDTPAHRLKRSFYLTKSFNTVNEIAYLFLLNYLIDKPEAGVGALYWILILRTLKSIPFFIPRMIFGKHQFYSTIMAYRNGQLVLWLLINRSVFKASYAQISQNLRRKRVTQ